MDTASEDPDPRQEPDAVSRSLASVERELLVLLAMFPESTEQLETMLVEEDLQHLSGSGPTAREGLTSVLRRLEHLGLVGHEVVGGSTSDGSTVWSLTSAGRKCRDTEE